MRPDVGSMSRLIIRSVVDLPHPDGPMSTAISPSRDLEAQVGDRGRRLAREDLGDVLELDHGRSPGGETRG